MVAQPVTAMVVAIAAIVAACRPRRWRIRNACARTCVLIALLMMVVTSTGDRRSHTTSGGDRIVGVSRGPAPAGRQLPGGKPTYPQCKAYATTSLSNGVRLCPCRAWASTRGTARRSRHRLPTAHPPGTTAPVPAARGSVMLRAVEAGRLSRLPVPALWHSVAGRAAASRAAVRAVAGSRLTPRLRSDPGEDGRVTNRRRWSIVSQETASLESRLVVAVILSSICHKRR